MIPAGRSSIGRRITKVAFTALTVVSLGCRASDVTQVRPPQNGDTLVVVAPVPDVSRLIVMGAQSDSTIPIVLPNGVGSATIAGNALMGRVELRAGQVLYRPSGVGRDEFVLDALSGDGRSLTFLVEVWVGYSGTREWQAVVGSPTTDETVFAGANLDDSRLAPLRPLVADIFRAYGNPTRPLDQVRAIRDWVARTAVHPYYWLHTSESHANETVLPSGETWVTLNEYVDRNTVKANIDDDVWWEQFNGDGIAMLDALIGTLDPATGRRAEDGMMSHVQGAQYRMRSIEGQRYMECSSQDRILILLWAVAGYHGVLLSTIGHDPAAVFLPDDGWVYEDATFNEEFTLRGSDQPVSPLDLMVLSRANRLDALVRRKMKGPSWSPDVYIDNGIARSDSYFREHPPGMLFLASQLNSVFVAPLPRFRLVQINVGDAPDDYLFPPDEYLPVTPNLAFPRLGAYVTEQRVDGGVLAVTLESRYPGTVAFERRVGGGSWTRVGNTDRVSTAAGAVEYRPVDGGGHHGASATIDARSLGKIGPS